MKRDSFLLLFCKDVFPQTMHWRWGFFLFMDGEVTYCGKWRPNSRDGVSALQSLSLWYTDGDDRYCIGCSRNIRKSAIEIAHLSLIIYLVYSWFTALIISTQLLSKFCVILLINRQYVINKLLHLVSLRRS